MYNIDINFLKDRPEYQGHAAKSDGTGFASNNQVSYSKTPMYIGLGIGITAILATAGGWLFLDQQAKTLQAKQAELDQQLGKLKTQETELAGLTGQVSRIEGESQALAGVFNSVRPWSAILQDFRESIPQGVQIQTIGQIAPPPPPVAPAKGTALPAGRDGSILAKAGAPPADPGASPSAAPTPAAIGAPSPAATTPGATAVATTSSVLDAPITKIKVTGIAQSFNDVNSFMLTLKKSAFLNPNDIQLVTANLVQEGANITGTGSTTTIIPIKAVKYEIQTSLKQVAAPELLRELEQKGAIGLVTRLKSLQQQQVMKP
jgi:type IV pilus assembly protein PilN